MARVCPPAAGCRQATVGGRTYTVQRDGTFHVPDAAVRPMIANGECFLPSVGLGRATGWRCVDCGFLAVLRTCGRCGGACERE